MEDSLSLVRRLSGKCGWERGLFWFVGCIFLKTIKPQQSSVCRSAHFPRKCPLLRSPEEVCLPLGWGEKAMHQPVRLFCFPGLWALSRLVWDHTKSCQHLRCWTGGENTNSGVIQGSVFLPRLNDFSLTPNITTPICFRQSRLFALSSKAPWMTGHVISWPHALDLPEACSTGQEQRFSAAFSLAASHVLSQNTHNPSIFPKTLLTSDGSLRSLPSSNHSLSVL